MMFLFWQNRAILCPLDYAHWIMPIGCANAPSNQKTICQALDARKSVCSGGLMLMTRPYLAGAQTSEKAPFLLTTNDINR